MTKNFKTFKKKQFLLLWLGFTLTSLGISAQTIETEKPDYMPGDTVLITGSGWQPGEKVDLSIKEVPTDLPNVNITIIADNEGNLISKEFITQEHHLGKALFIDARGDMGGMADVHFTDASFSTVKSGPWNKGETWGHPGNDVEGLGYPGAKDVATILNGHAVTLSEDAAALRVTISGNVDGSTKLDLNGYHLSAAEWVTLASSVSALRRCELHINGGTLTTTQVNVNTLNNGFSKVYLLAGRVNTNVFRIDSHYSNAFIRGWSELELGDDGVLDVTGNFIRTGTGDSKFFATENSHVLYTGSQAQLLRLDGGYVYGNVIITSNSTVIVKDHITPEKVKGNIIIEKGTFYLENNTSISGQPGKVFHLKDGARLRLSGHWSNSFPTVIIDKNSTVQYATGTQNIGAISYGNLELTGSGNKFLTGTTTVRGRFFIGLNYPIRAGNHNLILKGNFVNNGIFYQESSTVTFSGNSSMQTITGRATTFNNLIIDKEDGDLELGSNNISINGLLDLKRGKIVTGLHEVRVNGNGEIGGGSAFSYISGNLRRQITPAKQQYDFPIGTALGFTPSFLEFHELSGSGTILGKSIDGPHPYVSDLGFEPILNRHWEFENDAVGFNNFNLSLAFLPADMSEASDYNNFMVGKHNGSSWSYPGVGTKSPNSIQATGLNSFSSFAVGSGLVATKTTVENPEPVIYGTEIIILSAKVERQNDDSTPIEEGFVDFFMDEIKIGTSEKVSEGVATLEFDPSHLKVGSYQLLAVYSGSGMISDSSSDLEGGGVLVVEKAGLLIRAKDQDKIYGDAFNFSDSDYLVEGLVNDDRVHSVSIFSLGMDVTSSVTPEGVVYPIVASAAQGEGLENYDIQYLEGKFSVAAKPIALQVTDRKKIYGEELDLGSEAFSVSEGGLENGDLIQGVMQESLGSLATAPVGNNYAIVASGAYGEGVENYVIKYIDGKLTVEAKPISISASDRVKTYGDELDLGTTAFTVPEGALVNEDIIQGVKLESLGALVTSPVGDNYSIVANGAYGEGLDNYVIQYHDGNLTVESKPISISALDRVKTYGDELDLGTTAFTVPEGALVNEDIIQGVKLESLGALVTAPVGDNYSIVANGAYGEGLDNYVIQYHDGNLTVEAKPISISALDRVKTYGDELDLGTAAFTVPEGALVNEDIIQGVKLESLGASATAPVRDNYIIVASGAEGLGLENYDVKYVDGKLEVLKASLLVRNSDKNKSFGESLEDSDFTGSLIGVVAGDQITVMRSSIGEEEYVPVGDYPIVGTLVDPDNRLVNYSVSNLDGKLTVNKALTTISVANAITSCEGEVTLSATVTSTAQFEINETGGKVEFSYEDNFIGFVEHSQVLNGVFEGTFAHNFDAGNVYKIKAQYIPSNSNNLGGSNTTTEATFLDATVTSSVAENGKGNVVIFEGAASSLGLPSGTTLTASITPTYAGVTNKWSYVENGVKKPLANTSSTLIVNASGDFVRDYMVEIYSNGVCASSAMFKVISVEASCGNGNNKVQVCQVPPGNPNNRKTICVNANAVSALLANSDSFIGSCNVDYRVEDEEADTSQTEDFELVVVNWNTSFEELQDNLDKMSQDKFARTLTVKWFANGYDQFMPGYYEVRGEVIEGGNSFSKITIPVLIEDKALPTNIIISSELIAKSIVAGTTVADIYTVDEADDIHEYTMNTDVADNSFFKVQSGRLIWNSTAIVHDKVDYKISIQSIDRMGNTISRTFTLMVEVTGLNDLEIFNTFTPDNDGVNDTWGVPALKAVKDVRITIFDRSGKQVFQTQDPNEYWDGKHQGRELPVGAYFFVIESGRNGDVRRGTLNLLRK